MGRKSKPRWVRYVFGFLLLAALVAGGWAWWHVTHWIPPRDQYPLQGVLAGEQDGLMNFNQVRATGGEFAYLEASDGARRQDTQFTRNLAAAKAAGLQVGAVHRFDPCAPAETQAANFVTVVPRDASLLPPAIELDQGGEACEGNVSEAAVESELMTFLNQVEMHVGKPAVLKLSRSFEAQHHVAARMGRNLWVSQDRFAPTYAKRPWAIWTANSRLRSEASDHALRWLVVQP
ncbi:glycoside hydrolase family 25 protein [Altererythrobacter sp. CAU 1778]